MAENPAAMKKRIAEAKSSSAGALLISEHCPEIKATQILTPIPIAAIIELTSLFYERPAPYEGIHSSASVDETAELAEAVSVGPFAVIGKGVRIGARSIIHPHAVIYPFASLGTDCEVHASAVIREYTELGNYCVIQPGAVIGGDGFGYIPDKEIGHRQVPHSGKVVFEDYVDVGANSCIDRAMLGETRLGRSVKVDNQVMIGHNCQIGERTLMVSQVGISGSVKVGRDVVFAGKSSTRDHITIGDNVKVAGKTGITKSVDSNKTVAGYPHYEDVKQWIRVENLIRRLPELFREVKSLKSKLASSEQKQG